MSIINTINALETQRARVLDQYFEAARAFEAVSEVTKSSLEEIDRSLAHLRQQHDAAVQMAVDIIQGEQPDAIDQQEVDERRLGEEFVRVVRTEPVDHVDWSVDA